MKPTLSELIRPYRSISIIGMCKNAGKTTVLNQIIKEVNGNGRVLLRQSGTEPVIRVMVEAETDELCKAHAHRIYDFIKERGHAND